MCLLVPECWLCPACFSSSPQHPYRPLHTLDLLCCPSSASLSLPKACSAYFCLWGVHFTPTDAAQLQESA